MFISDKVAQWVSDLKKDADIQADVAKQAYHDLREDLAALRAERDSLRAELTAQRLNSDWLRLQWNQMQAENKALLERAYGVRVPVPEIINRNTESQFNLQDIFNDVGDDQARTMGMPLYGDKN